MRQKIQTIPNLSTDSPLHQEAKNLGDDHFKLWSRNVIDEYKSLTDEEIAVKLRETAHPFSVCFENFINDFNIATGIRNANAFNARSVYYVGDKKFDRRGAQGCYNYMDIHFLPTIDELISLKDKFTFIGIDNIPCSIPLSEHEWKPNTMIVFGSEGVGLTPAMQALCEKLVYIPMYGSIRSLNVGTASGIIMHDYVSKYKH